MCAQLWRVGYPVNEIFRELRVKVREGVEQVVAAFELLRLGNRNGEKHAVKRDVGSHVIA